MNWPLTLKRNLLAANIAIAVLFVLFAAPASATYAGQNGRIAFAANLSGTFQLYTINPDGSDMLQLTNLPPTDFPLWLPDYSPDGRRIVFSHDMTGAVELYVINADGTGLTQLTNDGGENIFPRWSPDGTRIVFSQLFSADFGYHHIATIKADGSDRRQLTNRLWDDYQPEYTVDSNHIIFASNFGGLVSALWIMDTNGAHKRRLTAAPLEAGGGDMSPDGKHMVFYSAQNAADRATSIWTANTDGTNLRRLTRPKDLVGLDPVYSPDGTKIVFHGGSRSTSNAVDLFTMNPDGSGVHRFAINLMLPGTCDLGGCLTPDWGANP